MSGEAPKLIERLLHIVIDNDYIIALRGGISKFDFSPCEPLLNIILAARAIVLIIKICMFHESILREKGGKFGGREGAEVIDAIDFTVAAFV